MKNGKDRESERESEKMANLKIETGHEIGGPREQKIIVAWTDGSETVYQTVHCMSGDGVEWGYEFVKPEWEHENVTRVGVVPAGDMRIEGIEEFVDSASVIARLQAVLDRALRVSA